MWHDFIYDLTPVESIGGMWWKREDKFCPLGYGNINGSKLRQLIWLFRGAMGDALSFHPLGVASGAVAGSPQHVMVAACAQHYGLRCVQFVGGNGAGKHDMIEAAKQFGAQIEFANPGYAATLNAKAREYALENLFFHVETNITVEHKINPAERVEAFHRVGSEQVKNIPDHIERLFVPAGSCNSLTSILYGLHRFPPKSLKEIHLFRIMANADKHRQWTNERLAIMGVKELPYKFVEHDLVDSGYTSYDKLVPYSYKELVFHPRYEGKCLKYMSDNIAQFAPLMGDKSLFWIVGSKPQ